MNQNLQVFTLLLAVSVCIAQPTNIPANEIVSETPAQIDHCEINNPNQLSTISKHEMNGRRLGNQWYGKFQMQGLMNDLAHREDIVRRDPGATSKENGKCCLYAEGEQMGEETNFGGRMIGHRVASAGIPRARHIKSTYNPISNNDHEVCVRPFDGGAMSPLTTDGPERNPIEWSLEGINFEIMSHIQGAPHAIGLNQSIDNEKESTEISRWDLTHRFRRGNYHYARRFLSDHVSDHTVKGEQETDSFPALIPQKKPTDRPLSAAMQRLYDNWNPHEDRGNELYSNFRYSPLAGLSYGGNISRRDPSKVLRINGTYYVWYTHRDTENPPSGPQKATETTPSFDWDLCEIWYATSKDGFNWEEQGPAVKRATSGHYGWRSVSTPDVLAWGGKYYLYYQGFNEIPGLKGDRAATTVAESDSPDGPWRAFGKVVVDFGAENEWDSHAIHDPYPIVFDGKIFLYYKGSPGRQGKDGTLVRAQGVAIAEHPLGPFTKSPLNPVLNSGHETCFFPWKKGVVGIVSLDGPEKNTVQFSPDGINFHVKALLQVPPIAPGPFIPDAFADTGDGRGITWGLCHINPDGGSSHAHSILARFDCDLSLDVDRRAFKRNNLRFEEQTYFQERVKLPKHLDIKIRRDRESVDMNTIAYGTKDLVKKPSLGKTAPKEFEIPDSEAFPGVMPSKKPTHRELSASWARMWDRWNPHEDRGNELYSNFKYSPVEGLKDEPNVSRRDPSKVIRIDDTYYVWYTCRRSNASPVGLKKATETLPATDWDLADIWYATSDDGYTWTEQGVAVQRPEKPTQGYRSICTPDILIWKGKYYLYFQAYSPMVGGSAYCPVMAAVADSPEGPWVLHEKPVIQPGPKGTWNNIKINDPNLLVVNDRILMYYKGAPKEKGDQYVLRFQGVSFADDPLGPFVPSKLNPVINSGHETCMWPWKGGVAALVALDGPEKNTIQFSPDGENFEVMSMVQVPPIAPGPFISDAFASDSDGRGFTWGLAHINQDGGGATSESKLVRFDCDLSLNVDRPVFKRNNLRFEQSTYFQTRVRLPDSMRKQIDRERDRVDRNTVLGSAAGVSDPP